MDYKITIESGHNPPITELEADIISAGTPVADAEEKKRAVEQIRSAQEFVFSPEVVAELAKDGITPEDVVKMMLKGNFSELKKLPE